ncbi:hypothetical protein B0H14DRAFT_3854607 [Mycena olivaceomarginata]|nr:hypothetical protein B0H14DRAFT_3854607 [Mycena olivaceomarginata]
MCDQSTPPTNPRSKSNAPKAEDVTVWLRWAVSPLSAALVLVLPPLLALPTHFILPYLPPSLQTLGNPFTPFFLLSHAAPPPNGWGQVYVKGPADLPILAWSVVFFSLLRLLLTHHAFPALAHYYGIRKPGKVSRFGEQGYAVVYFAVMGAWGSPL